MAAVLEMTLNSDREDGIIACPVWDHIPRIGETVLIRVDGPYIDYRVVGVEHMCDAGRPETVPHVAIYIEPTEE